MNAAEKLFQIDSGYSFDKEDPEQILTAEDSLDIGDIRPDEIEEKHEL